MSHLDDSGTDMASKDVMNIVAHSDTTAVASNEELIHADEPKDTQSSDTDNGEIVLSQKTPTDSECLPSAGQLMKSNDVTARDDSNEPNPAWQEKVE
ncbi:hypothetical protein ACEQ8H_008061 [Pleosporales sp. CAS-2024a]